MARTKQVERPLILDNIVDGETVYQRAIIIHGRIVEEKTQTTINHVAVSSKDPAGLATFPDQSWPVSGEYFKAIVLLSPGANVISLKHSTDYGDSNNLTINLTYIPLLQCPPLHLAIMVAKDSPLLIDCPPCKQGGISSAHSDLDAAIKKFRMTAYMWQALTAEDMRSKGLGRRSFRLEEEWATETLSKEFLQNPRKSSGSHMRSTAKVHIIRSEKTIEELRDLQVAQQNEEGANRDDLHKYFTAALKKHGSPFEASASPIVAGLILDSTFSEEDNMIVGHAALGNSNPKGISLGMFGSHLTYSWPRFMEEVTSSLLDTNVPGDSVGNDCGQCGTMWEACSIGQGAFLHEVGHAFGADHTTGIMNRGYAQDWPKNFLAKTAYCAWTDKEGETVIPEDTSNEACWDVKHALSFKVLPHFRLPTDEVVAKGTANAAPTAAVEFGGNETDVRLVITSPFQVARIMFNDITEPIPSVAGPCTKVQYSMKELEAQFKRTEPLKLEVLGMNGKTQTVGNVWRLFAKSSHVLIPTSSIVIQKRSVICTQLEEQKNRQHNARKVWEWAVLLNEKSKKNGKLVPATKIDSRVGCGLDGAVVYFADGHSVPCGPRWTPQGGKHDFGGHAAEKFDITGLDITKVEVGGDYSFNGLRFHMSNGKHGGYLYEDSPVQTLEAGANEKIIGFYGTSEWQGGWAPIQEFGIFTVPKDAVLPDIVYEMPELQNVDGGNGPRYQLKRKFQKDEDDDEDEDRSHKSYDDFNMEE